MIATSPRPPVADVLRGRLRLVGARYSRSAAPGWLSPVDARRHLGLAYDDPAEVEEAYERRRTLGSDLAVCLRAAIAHALPGGGDRPAPPRLEVLGTAVDNVTADEAIAAICAAAAEPVRTTMFHFVHAHALTVAAEDVELRRHLAAADWVLPDGVGLRVAASMLGHQLRANVNGTDLFAPLLAALGARRARLALVGGAPGVAERCADWIRGQAPALELASTSSGFLSPPEIDALRARLRALAPCVVLVGMGTPIQEHWAWLHLADLPGLTILTVGGLFDFHAGRVRRAPAAWREVGLEWLYRLGQEPRRLARRNLINHPRFLARVAAQRLARHL